MTAITNNICFAKEEDAEKWFDCDYCAYTFDVYDEYRSHIFTHFNTKHCSECNVKLIRICGDEWFSLHTTSNCQHNKHVDDLSSIGPDNDEDIIPLVIKEEELQSEIDADHLDDLLDVEGDDDDDICDFGQIFAAELSASIGTEENNDIHATYSQQANANRQQSTQNAQFNYKDVSIIEKNQTVNEVEHKPRSIGFQCRFCDKKFKSRFQLDSHVQSHHIVEKSTRCKHCNENFNSFDQLDRHLRKCPWNNRKRKYEQIHPHRPAFGPFTCDICGNKLKKFAFLVLHMNENHSKKCSYQCRICERLYPSRYYLAKHLIRHKQAFDGKQKNKNDLDANLMERRKYDRIHPHRPSSNFICDICGKTTPRFETLQEHMNRSHGAANSFSCRFCGRFYPNRYYLQKHILRHKTNSLTEGGEMVEDLDKGLMERNKYNCDDPSRRGDYHPCDECDQVFKHFESLQGHKGSFHSSGSTFPCRKCGRMYPNRYYLSKHMKRHEEAEKLGIAEDILYKNVDERLIERRKYNRIDPSKRELNLTCDECGKNFKHISSLMEHKSSRHSSENKFPCDKCGRMYPNRYYLTKHMTRHEEAEKLSVSEEQLFEDMDEGLMERRKCILKASEDMNKTEFDCDECDRKFTKFYLLTRHKRTKHDNFQCLECGLIYPNQFYLTHMERHESTTRVSSIQFADNTTNTGCDSLLEISSNVSMMSFSENTKTKRHTIDDNEPVQENGSAFEIKSVESINLSRYETEKSYFPSSFTCDICQITASDHHEIIEHMQSKHWGKTKVKQKSSISKKSFDFTSDTCGMMYDTYESFMEHMTSNHSSKDRVTFNRPNPNQNQNCPPKHMKRHLNETNNQEFSLDDNLIERNRYVRVHPHRPSSFTCDICQKTVSSYYSMREHMQSKHSDEAKVEYNCSNCKKIFVSKKRLEKHFMLHHNPKKEVEPKVKKKQMCSVCGRFFADKSKMLIHERTHFGIKTSCEICGKQFLIKYYLSKHMKSVHEKKRPFLCTVDGCNEKFGYLQTMKRHQARKHGMVIQRNACPICSKEFPDSTYHLKRHLKAHANNTAKEYIPDSQIKIGNPEA